MGTGRLREMSLTWVRVWILHLRCLWQIPNKERRKTFSCNATMFLPAANHVFVEITNTTRHVRLKLHRIGSLRCVMILYHTICNLEGTKIMMIVIESGSTQKRDRSWGSLEIMERKHERGGPQLANKDGLVKKGKSPFFESGFMWVFPFLSQKGFYGQRFFEILRKCEVL